MEKHAQSFHTVCMTSSKSAKFSVSVSPEGGREEWQFPYIEISGSNRIIMLDATSAGLCVLPADGGIISPSPLTTGYPDAPFNRLIGAGEGRNLLQSACSLLQCSSELCQLISSMDPEALSSKLYWGGRKLSQWLITTAANLLDILC